MAAPELIARVRLAYPREDFPALNHQIDQWSKTRPLDGAAVLDATPVFGNTLAKYAALVAAGAHVSVSAHRAIPGDPAIISALRSLGIAVVNEDAMTRPYDLVFDCAGTHTDVPSRYGYVELTRSGVPAYAHSTAPVFVADAGRIKRIETTLGTADGFVRGMQELGSPVTATDTVLVFGGGKVGTGVAHGCREVGAEVVLVDPQPVDLPGVPRLDPGDQEIVSEAIRSASVVVAATGVTAALQPWREALLATPAALANMGATDEFGPHIPASAVLNCKVAVNFVLAEPTRLRYLDPTMALSNAGGLELVRGTVPPGPNDPPAELEEALLDVVRRDGVVAGELQSMGL